MAQYDFQKILELIFSLIIPPIGVFLHRGLGNEVVICILLTLLGYIPGLIYAIFIIVSTKPDPGLKVT
jgi:uncharacterized membrane protein YqaE (UPF0057 family)